MRRALTLLGLCITTATVLAGQTLTTLVNFDGNNGLQPSGSLIQATDGNFYGVTEFGGFKNTGTAFKMTPDGVLTTVYVFCVLPGCPDGEMPKDSLVQANDGNLYGTTYEGGSGYGGTIFRITPQGDLTTLHSFNFKDGAFPQSWLVQTADGNFYGTTSAGGQNGSGSVFKISPEGALSVLYSFSFGFAEGYSPVAGLVQASDINLYGTTSIGGPGGGGSVFRVTPAGTLTTLHSFSGTDGFQPFAGLVQGTDGELYGTTYYGGAQSSGTVFKISLQGALTTLYSFCPQQNCPDGENPAGSLIQATDGNFYGTTAGGGQNNWGTVFKITPDGTLTTLYSFNRTDGGSPSAGLVQAPDGSFYGTTSLGGSSDQGTVFRLIAYPALSVVKSGMGTVISGDGHIYCGSACSYWYFDGSRIGLTAIPAPGYTFGGWSGCDNSNGNFCSVVMAGERNLTATFDVAQVTLTSLTFKPSYVKGGQLSAATLTLSAPAPDGGVTVGLSSDHPSVAHPPSFVIVPGGKSSVIFGVNTFPVKSNTTVMITATAGSSQVSGTLTVGTTSLPPSLR